MTNAVRESLENPDCPRAPEDVIRDLRSEVAALAAARLALHQENENLQTESGEGFRFWQQKWMDQHHRAETAEAELTQLREALGALPRYTVVNVGKQQVVESNVGRFVLARDLDARRARPDSQKGDDEKET